MIDVGSVNISYGNTTEAGTNIKGIANNMASTLAAIATEMSKINQEDTWKSDSAETLFYKFATLSRNFDNLYQLLNQYGDFLVKAADTYQKSDKYVETKMDELLVSADTADV